MPSANSCYLPLAVCSQPRSVARPYGAPCDSRTIPRRRDTAVIFALVCGGGVGAGLWLVARGWSAPRLSLSEALIQLRSSGAQASSPVLCDDTAIDGSHRPPDRRPARAIRYPLGDVARRGSRPSRCSPEVARRISLEKVTLALVGLLLVPATTAVLALGGAHLPLPVPLWGSIVCGAVAFWIPDLGIHAEAQERRRDFRHAARSLSRSRRRCPRRRRRSRDRRSKTP